MQPSFVFCKFSQTHSFKQPFENVFFEEARLRLLIKTIHIASIYLLPSAKCNWVTVQKAYTAH